MVHQTCPVMENQMRLSVNLMVPMSGLPLPKMKSIILSVFSEFIRPCLSPRNCLKHE